MDPNPEHASLLADSIGLALLVTRFEVLKLVSRGVALGMAAHHAVAIADYVSAP